jgi:ubiquinone/menaquinone biosynthesis C-methylase UbiE
MHLTHNARASMLGIAHRPDRYEHFSRLAGRLYRRIAADVVAEVAAGKLPPDARILDVGTGPGMVPLKIAAAGPQLRIDAVDLSPEMIAQAQESAVHAGVQERITFAVADVAVLPFADDSFDLIVSSLSQHHWADPGAGMQEVSRVLRPGGQAWIYDFRFSLSRAQRAAGAVRPAVPVVRQSPLPGTHWFNPVGRLVLAP